MIIVSYATQWHMVCVDGTVDMKQGLLDLCTCSIQTAHAMSRCLIQCSPLAQTFADCRLGAMNAALDADVMCQYDGKDLAWVQAGLAV
jgi:hypothetical protein